MGLRAEEQGKNGMNPRQRLAKHPSSSSKVPIINPKVRKCHSVNDMGIAYAQPLPTAREASICQALTSFRIGEEKSPSRDGRNQVVSSPETPTPVFKVPSNITMRSRGHGDKPEASERGKFRDGPVVPKTPTPKEMMQQLARVDSTYRAARTPLMSPSPTKASFLTKESNLHNFVAWDVDERLGNFESEFKAMKEMINNSISGQKSLEDDVAAVRQKGEYVLGVFRFQHLT